MKTKRGILSILACLSLLAMPACAGSAPAPTGFPTIVPTFSATDTLAPTDLPATRVPPTPLPGTTPAPTQPSELYLVSSSSYTDAAHNYHVVGEINNAGSKSVDQIVLSIEIRDAAGGSLLKDSAEKQVDTLSFTPLIHTLAPGESSPFHYFLNSFAGAPDSYRVTIRASHATEVLRPLVLFDNTQLKLLNNGIYYLTGELVNMSTAGVEVRELAGALLDKDRHIVSANDSNTYSIYLAATDAHGPDRSPFAIRMDDPGGTPTSWNAYIDARPATGASTQYAMEVKLTNAFFDENKMYHVVGTVTNNSWDTVNTSLVAGLYASDGSTIDAFIGSPPVNLAPDETLPFDISTFDNVNNNADDAGRLKNFSVQVDSFNTNKSSFATLGLKSSSEQVTKGPNSWSVSGQVANTSAKTLSSETVLVGVYDASGKLLASSWSELYPGGSGFEPGAVATFKIDIPLAPGVDASGFTYKVKAKGTIK